MKMNLHTDIINLMANFREGVYYHEDSPEALEEFLGIQG